MPGPWRAAAHAALLAGAGTLASVAGAEPTIETRAFAPPIGDPMILARTVVRELPGGAAIVATRRYRVSFRPVPGGWEVSGALISSEIAVPPSLATIAAIERARPDQGMFPMRLDGTGRIVGRPIAQGMGREAVAGAVGAALHRADAEPEAGFLTQIGAAAASGGGLTGWPEELFLPHGPNGSSEQKFALPDGGTGSVRVTLESVPAASRTTMGRVARTVVTQAAGSRRVAREEWTLAAETTGTLP